MTFEKQITILTEDSGIRLDRWFRRHHPDVSFTVIAKLVRKGDIRLNQQRVTTGKRLEAGQCLSYPAKLPKRVIEKSHTRPPKALTQEDIAQAQAMIVHRDDSCIVINKPTGLATQGGSKTYHHVDRLLDAYRFEREERPRLVHRLDKDTSGIMLLARSAFAAHFFTDQFRTRNSHKTYWALVQGKPYPGEGLIVAPLSKQGRTVEKVTVDDSGQEAQTSYKILRHIRYQRHILTWLELTPLTGRTHQLRVHCAEILGCPIVGDRKYGTPIPLDGITPKLHLHARRLKVAHPCGDALTVEAPLPPHMAQSWTLLNFDKHSRKQEKKPYDATRRS